MVRTNQGGSVLSFIIIGTVMTLLLLGGIYIVRQQVGIGASVPAPTQPQAPTSGDDSPNPSDEETASEQPDKEPPVATPVVPREEEKPTATPHSKSIIREILNTVSTSPVAIPKTY